MSHSAGGSAETGKNWRQGKASAKVSALNIANALTLLRLLLIPLFAVALFAGDSGQDSETGWRLIATALFAFASFTDQMDGWVARRYGLVTNLGKIADPIADKALIGTALIGLSLLGELGWWVTVVILVRELGITALRFWVIRHGVIAASPGGKAKTITQILAIIAYLLPLPDSFDALHWVLMGIALILTVATGADYVRKALRLRASGGTAG